jgi:hypothetical protein
VGGRCAHAPAARSHPTEGQPGHVQPTIREFAISSALNTLGAVEIVAGTRKDGASSSRAGEQVGRVQPPTLKKHATEQVQLPRSTEQLFLVTKI